MKNVSAPPIPVYAWIILILIFCSSIAAPLSMFKIPPVMDAVMKHFSISMGAAGWLMSIFAVVGVLLALPAGFIIARIGVKNTGLAALFFLAIGSTLGALSSSMVMLLGSRILEGVGLCLMSIVAPTALSAWFPANKRGLAMGIWGTWVPLGSISIFTLAPKLEIDFGWAGAWWFCAGYAAVMFICFLLFFKMPKQQNATAEPNTEDKWQSMLNVLRNPNPWRLAISFGCYNVLAISLITFMPIFFQQARQYSAEDAALLATAMLVANMAAILLGGVVSDYIGSRKKCIVWSYVLVSLCMCFFYLPGNAVIYTMIIVGILGGFAVTPTFSAAPELVTKPEDTGTSLAILAVGQNLGMFVGPALYGAVADSVSWSAAGYITVPIMLIGAYFAYKTSVR